MLRPILLIATFLAAMIMGQALAHALELPGKMRLDREQYYIVQTIYYPGFTLGGMAEPLAIVAAAAAVLIGSETGGPIRLTVGALIALVLTQLLFWLRVQPVNRQWLGSSTELSDAAEKFFRTGRAGKVADNWTKLRDRWERGHLARAATSTGAFVLLLLASASS